MEVFLWPVQEGCRAVFRAFRRAFCFCGTSFVGRAFCWACFGENRGCISIVIFRHSAVDCAQRIPTDTGDGVAYPLRSVFRQGMMLVLKIYIPNFEGSRISKSAGSPFVKSRAGGGSLSISGKTKSTAGCYDSVENRVLLACKGCFCILAGWLKLLLNYEHGLRWPL